jgi:hypothetical protein
MSSCARRGGSVALQIRGVGLYSARSRGGGDGILFGPVSQTKKNGMGQKTNQSLGSYA